MFSSTAEFCKSFSGQITISKICLFDSYSTLLETELKLNRSFDLKKKQFEKIIHEKIWISSLSSPNEKWFSSVKIKSKLETNRCFFLISSNIWFLRWLKGNLEKSSTKKGECQKVQAQISNIFIVHKMQKYMYEC